MLILGVGFLAMFAGVDSFWMIWVFGFAVVLPIVAILLGDSGDGSDEVDRRDPDVRRRASEDDPLETLRDRYARGEIDEETFERRLEALLETETPEGARERVERRARDRTAGRDAEREPNR